MLRTLERHLGTVLALGPVRPKQQTVGKLLNGAARLLGKQYDYTHSIFMSRGYAAAFTPKLATQNFDLIFAPAASTQIARLETNLPIVYTSDATFARMVDYQPGFSRLIKHSIR